MIMITDQSTEREVHLDRFGRNQARFELQPR
jgi:hypothetical protein